MSPPATEVRGDFRPPAGFNEVAERLESRGHEAWAVGGALRDELTGRTRADWDLATDARPGQVRAIFGRSVPIGIEHGTVGVIASDGSMYEVTTFRRDIETDGRHAVVEFSDTVDEDLGRRDFTINALAWRPETGELRDPFGGRRDLAEGILRAVGEAGKRFAEDYLRVLRAFRFAGRYRLDIEEATRTALAEAVAGTRRLSAERVREELMKVLSGRNASSALRLYGEFGALGTWYPEVAEAADADPRWELHLAAVDAISPDLPGRPTLRLARWLVPIADGEAERVERARELLARLKFSNADTERVAHLLARYEPLPGPVDSDAQLRVWLAATGEEHFRDVLRLHIAGARAAGAAERGRFLVFLWRRLHRELLSHPPLTVGDLALGGRDLLELGVEQGPAVGLLLDELHTLTLEEPALNEPDLLRERARGLIEIGRLDRLAGGPGDG